MVLHLIPIDRDDPFDALRDEIRLSPTDPKPSPPRMNEWTADTKEQTITHIASGCRFHAPLRRDGRQRIKSFCGAKPTQKVQRIKSFCGAKPTQKVRWTNAEVEVWAGLYGDFTADAWRLD